MTAAIDSARATWRQRRQIEDVLNPRRNGKYAHLDFAIDLAIRHGVTLRMCELSEAKCWPAKREIQTAPISGDQEFSTFLHELGHIVDVHQSRVHTFEDELAAWRWAMAAAGRRWTRAMTENMAQCLATYQWSTHINYAQLIEMETVIAAGAEQARHVVKILQPAPRPGVVRCL